MVVDSGGGGGVLKVTIFKGVYVHPHLHPQRNKILGKAHNIMPVSVLPLLHPQ